MFTLEKIYPLEKILPLCAKGKPFIIEGNKLHKPKALQLVATHGIHCKICNKPAKEFHLLKNQNNHKFIRLVFDHKDTSNEYAFMNVDHIIPTSKNGSNKDHNLQPTCSLCNTKKDNKLTLSTDWLTKLYYIALIKFYITHLDKNLTVKGFNNSYKSIFIYVKKCMKNQQNFDIIAWEYAKHSIINTIQQEINKKTKVIHTF